MVSRRTRGKGRIPTDSALAPESHNVFADRLVQWGRTQPGSRLRFTKSAGRSEGQSELDVRFTTTGGVTWAGLRSRSNEGRMELVVTGMTCPFPLVHVPWKGEQVENALRREAELSKQLVQAAHSTGFRRIWIRDVRGLPRYQQPNVQGAGVSEAAKQEAITRWRRELRKMQRNTLRELGFTETDRQDNYWIKDL